MRRIIFASLWSTSIRTVIPFLSNSPHLDMLFLLVELITFEKPTRDNYTVIQFNIFCFFCGLSLWLFILRRFSFFVCLAFGFGIILLARQKKIDEIRKWRMKAQVGLWVTLEKWYSNEILKDEWTRQIPMKISSLTDLNRFLKVLLNPSTIETNASAYDS